MYTVINGERRKRKRAVRIDYTSIPMLLKCMEDAANSRRNNFDVMEKKRERREKRKKKNKSHFSSAYTTKSNFKI